MQEEPLTPVYNRPRCPFGGCFQSTLYCEEAANSSVPTVAGPMSTIGTITLHHHQGLIGAFERSMGRPKSVSVTIRWAPGTSMLWRSRPS